MALVELASFHNSFEVGLVQARLSAAGIDSFIFDMGMGQIYSGHALAIRLMIDEDDADAAAAILAEPA